MLLISSSHPPIGFASPAPPLVKSSLTLVKVSLASVGEAFGRFVASLTD
jgi:hypothetical protein